MVDVSDLLGVPYKEHGRSAAEGFDCYGLVMEVSKRMGKTMQDLYYTNHALTLSAEYAPTLPLKETFHLEEGTIIEMDYKGNLHIGIALNKKEFIHATSKGVRINRIGIIPIRKFYTWES